MNRYAIAYSAIDTTDRHATVQRLTLSDLSLDDVLAIVEQWPTVWSDYRFYDVTVANYSGRAVAELSGDNPTVRAMACALNDIDRQCLTGNYSKIGA